ncbi:beta-ketoacyl-[acyl-carrier-protein] synthase family protein [Pseudomonas benzenivorans]|uniref:Beta-ketoacyl-[acyl-carrier-protein] synthase family protein n=1 Tax=Pseudomonas benzenivorans TaxID=556533 RepID=A0ABZ0Q0Y8_9PSED|nr:beta-ketoacyl-[acyl-carrier-protein] synthase family protein [Pseudomonas benzenivorans]WPC07109.1 beta-ketoacyl-[acyl-carrier-protein] synthase family protein [Pseudomonas benzenivorans]
MPSYLNALGLLCALGHGQSAVAKALFAGDASGMHAEDGWVADRRLTVGSVPGALPTMPAGLESAQSRNNRLLLGAALQIEAPIRASIARYGSSRVGVVIGTSTSGIHEASQSIARFVQDGALPADYHYAQQEMVAPAAFLADWLGLSGPTYCLSTACTSSARALLSAHRLLQQGLCDAVLCGGVDSLCRLTLNGFSALEAVSAAPCNPFSANRQGINIGEGAALFLMTREPPADDSPPIALLGGGASSDAHHISAPQPEGLGAQQAMRSALAAAALAPEQIDYLNLHGTATAHNDAMESLAVQALFPAGVPCSSTKPLTGHCLGAAGALEAAFCWLTLSAHNPDGRLPPHLWDGQADPQLPPLALVTPGSRAAGPLRHLMSNSFAFGGSNLSLILGVPT